ncbi:MAG: hypothetical protein ACYC6Y_23605 [Thermoguttaceae bacterium]
MDTKQLILERLDETCRSLDLDDLGDIRWNDAQVLRKCAIRAERGDLSGWDEFLAHVNAHRRVACGFIRMFENLGWAEYSIENECMELTLPQEYPPIDDGTKEDLIAFLNPSFEIKDEKPKHEQPGVIMYIEEKRGLAGHAKIGRVTFSATRRTIYYAGRKLQSLKGGYKANYYDVDSGLKYWISNCKKDGNDTLYPGIVEIDDDAREEYWTTIRKMPENVHVLRFRSEGKYAKRRPS